MTLNNLPWLAWTGGAYVLMSAVALCAYAADKAAALRGRRRISERTLHTISLLGGWPGALVSQHLFRHKRRKLRFVVLTWLIAAAHVAVLLHCMTR